MILIILSKVRIMPQKLDAFEKQPNFDVPSWHISIVMERLEEFKNDPTLALDFDQAMDEIEKELR